MVWYFILFSINLCLLTCFFSHWDCILVTRKYIIDFVFFVWLSKFKCSLNMCPWVSRVLHTHTHIPHTYIQTHMYPWMFHKEDRELRKYLSKTSSILDVAIYPLVFSVFWSYSFLYVLGSKFTFGEWHILSKLLTMLSLNFFYLLDSSFTLSMQDTNKFTPVFSIYKRNRPFD